MKYGEIVIKGYPSNVRIFYGEDRDSLHLECTGDVPILGYTNGNELAWHIEGLTRRGQINFIKRYSESYA